MFPGPQKRYRKQPNVYQYEQINKMRYNPQNGTVLIKRNEIMLGRRRKGEMLVKGYKLSVIK
jgi:hypothetical protein